MSHPGASVPNPDTAEDDVPSLSQGQTESVRLPDRLDIQSCEEVGDQREEDTGGREDRYGRAEEVHDPVDSIGMFTQIERVEFARMLPKIGLGGELAV